MVSRIAHRLAVLCIRATAVLAVTVAVFVAVVLTSPILTSPANASGQEAIAVALKAKFDGMQATALRPADRAAVQAFYEGRGWSPVWADETGLTRAARLSAAELQRAGDWGLSESDFKLPALASLPSAGLPVSVRWTADQAAAADLELTFGVLEYAHQARGGRIAEPDRMLSTYLDRRPQLIAPAFVLVMIQASQQPDAVLRSFHPKHAQFRTLQAAYQRLRATTKADPRSAVPQQGAMLLPGTRHDDVKALRTRFNLPADVDQATLYDAAVVAAVKRFQDSAGLNDDGIVGNATRKALNNGPELNLDALRANLEQWRWMPDSLGDTHLFVNIPEFKVRMVSAGEVTLEERVITGKGDTQTPVFSKSLSTVVLRPTWKLPDSIKLEKLLSAQRSGRSLEDQGYRIKKGKKYVDSGDVDWSKANLAHYEFYQPSGDGNALGDVKFLFPNKHSVYLHDTPMKSLFNEDARLFSHGCIRLRNPLTLAQVLLDRDRGYGRMNVKALVEDGPEVNEVALERPVPIHVGYFTAWADSATTVRTFGDPYGHEQRIRQALDGKWKDIDKGDDHLAAVDTWQLKTVRVEQRAQPTNPRRFAPPSGVTRTPSNPWAAAGSGPKMVTAPSKKWKGSRDGGVGDIMRNALMNN